MDEEKPETAGNARRWWLSTGGEPEGPHSESYILVGLKTGKIPASALACPVGGQEWKPMSEWPEFAGHGQDPATPALQAPLPPPDSLLINPQLPTMANWICVYAILVSPFLWIAQSFSCCITLSPTFSEDSVFSTFEFGLYVLDALVSLGLVILFVLGGIRLRSLRRSGAHIVKLALWISLGSFVLFLLFAMGLGVVAILGGDQNFAEDTSTTAQTLIDFMSMLVDFAELAFQIIALVCLYRNAKSLPLTET